MSTSNKIENPSGILQKVSSFNYNTLKNEKLFKTNISYVKYLNTSSEKKENIQLIQNKQIEPKVEVFKDVIIIDKLKSVDLSSQRVKSSFSQINKNIDIQSNNVVKNVLVKENIKLFKMGKEIIFYSDINNKYSNLVQKMVKPMSEESKKPSSEIKLEISDNITKTEDILKKHIRPKVEVQINNTIPVVTIIVPMYNVEMYIKDCIISLLNQSYGNIKIILVDDCSIDNTKKIADYFCEKYPLKIKVISNLKNIGTYRSINRGIINSTGEYITIIGSDDQFTINKVKEQVDILTEHLNYVACFCQYKRIHYKTNKVLVKDVGESTIMFRRKIIEEIGYYDSVRFGADSEYRDRIRTVYGKKAMYIIKSVLYLALLRPNSLISSGKSIQGSRFRIQYRNNYSKWHRHCKKLYMEYPLLQRKFNVANELL